MAAALLAWKATASSLPNSLLSLGGILVGMLVYGAGLWVLKTRELRTLFKAVNSRLFKN